MQKNNSDLRGWYLVYTKPRAEQTALENLERQNYSVYLPKMNVNLRRRGRYITQTEPMFPRYLFIQLNCTTDNWSPIRSTLGVSSMVRFGAYPLQVPDDLIELLKANEDEYGIQTIETKKFEKGNRVRIIDGAMSGCEGIFESETSKDRVVILLNIAGQYTRVSMTRHDLQFA